jgi:hypothetical protein
MGFAVILNPVLMKRMLIFWRQGKRIYLGGILRATFGVIFLLSALEAGFSWAIYWLGVFMLMAALLIFALGLEKVKAMLGWWDKRPPVILRLMGFLTFAIGVLIIYSA